MRIESSYSSNKRVVIIGGGPAGLMAAQTLLDTGLIVDLYERMPSPGRKFLVAGSTGLNLTKDEPLAIFLKRYRKHEQTLEPFLSDFGPDQMLEWLEALGFESFTGSSGKVFPAEMTAGKILHKWLEVLQKNGLRLYTNHRWIGWTATGALQFDTPGGIKDVNTEVVILALGGGSWPQTGSDASWVEILTVKGVLVSSLKPANCGFNIGWSEYFKNRFAGHPVKTVQLHFKTVHGEIFSQRGEFVITEYGVEGSLVYAASSLLREEIEDRGKVMIRLDLAPDFSTEQVLNRLQKPRGKRTLSHHLERTLGFKGLKTGLLYEVIPPEELQETEKLAAAVKSLPLLLQSARPITEAISTAGGVSFDALDSHLMLKEMPGVFCAGEMLDWEAPTGGYLLTACFSTGYAAARGVIDWLNER